MSEIEYQINDKVVLMCPIDVYVDVFSMTGNIINIEHFEDVEDSFIYSIQLEEPNLLEIPDLWKNDKNEYVCHVTKDFFVPLSDLDPSHVKWINKGKSLLENTNCFTGSLYFLNEVIYGLENDQMHAALQALSRYDISWLENIEATERFEAIKLMIANIKIPIRRCMRELKKFKEFIAKKQSMIN